MNIIKRLSLFSLVLLSITVSFSARSIEQMYADGTGFVVSSDGYIVTEYHVIEGTKNTVIVLDGKAYVGMIVMTDPKDDLAVLKISLDHEAPFMNVVLAVPGENVIAFGYDLGNPPLKDHIGNLDATGDEPGFLGMTAYVCHGDSGGPVVNKNLDVVGVTHSFFGKDGDSCNHPSQASSGEAVLKLLDKLGIKQVPGHQSVLSPVFIESEVI